MGIISIIISFVFVLLLQKFPRAVIWTSLVLVGLLLLLGAGLATLFGSITGAVIALIILGIYLFVLYSFRYKL